MRIKIIIGMFKMEDGDIFVREGKLVISTVGGERSIPLSDIESISMTRHIGRSTRFEINLNGESLEGIFVSTSDADGFADSLKGSMGSVLQINFQGE